ncbi:hypothetical protein [Spiroplasma taiwanense]|uniref:Uncharacterized protein n=1 Tax=Spiroplasma taiwanense CT-1 TaxID=1276220 RepID=S5MAZ2_9MOLU|nr:hypothetical protein [Spiroplasma taiwanense]AGR40938.1 hypothetical protein STAIW_v1c02740 [Spiroplasma taiwanense CT-1]
MKKINIFKNDNYKFSINIGIIDEKICFIGFPNDDIFNWFPRNKFLIIENNEKCPTWINNIIDDFFEKKIQILICSI